MRKLVLVVVAVCFLIPITASVANAGPLSAIERCFQHPLSCLSGRTEWKANTGKYEPQRHCYTCRFRATNRGRPKTTTGGGTRSIQPVTVVEETP